MKRAEKFEQEIGYLIEQAEELEGRQSEKEHILVDVSNVDRETKAWCSNDWFLVKSLRLFAPGKSKLIKRFLR